MDAINECMNMTSHGGTAKSLGIIAIQQARKGDFDAAADTLQKAEAELFKGHEAHVKLLAYDVENEDLRVSVFMIHAASHMSSAETIIALAEEIVLLLKEGVKC